MTAKTSQSRGAIAHIRETLAELAERPLAPVAWVLVLPIALILSPIWGSGFAMIGWLSARERLRQDGLEGLGAALAPELARKQYERGVFAGIWHTQKLGIAVSLIELPTMLIAFAPAAAAYFLLQPAQMLFAPTTGLAISYGVPGLLGLAAATVVGAQTFLVYRLLGESGPDYSLGLVFRMVGHSWRLTLRNSTLLVTLAAGLLAVTLVGGAFVGVSVWGARKLELGGGTFVVLTWTAAVAGLAQLSVTLNALASWAMRIEAEPIMVSPEHFSFGRWLGTWLKATGEWLRARGVISVGIGACLIIGALTGLVALVSGKNFESWVGLGWFAVTALTLVAVNGQRSHA
jgi:hypothetical protein